MLTKLKYSGLSSIIRWVQSRVIWLQPWRQRRDRWQNYEDYRQDETLYFGVKCPFNIAAHLASCFYSVSTVRQVSLLTLGLVPLSNTSYVRNDPVGTTHLRWTRGR